MPTGMDTVRLVLQNSPCAIVAPLTQLALAWLVAANTAKVTARFESLSTSLRAVYEAVVERMATQETLMPARQGTSTQRIASSVNQLPIYIRFYMIVSVYIQ
jgi:hypothetical protein